MSLSTLLLDENKQYLNARVNNLKLDGVIQPNLSNGYLYDAISTINYTIPVGGFTTLKDVTINNVQYRTTVYEVVSSLQITFFSVAQSLASIRFVVYNNETSSNFYVGRANVISGETGDRSILSLVDSVSVPSTTTSNFELLLEIESTAPLGEECIASGMTVIKSVAQQ
jgi:hypothetical protein